MVIQMSTILSSLKIVQAKRQSAIDPLMLRRNKLLRKLEDQINAAKALSKGESFLVKRVRNITDKQTSEIRAVEVSRKIRQWWFVADSGKVVIQLKYGSKVIDIAKGKNSVEVSNGAELIAVLETLKSACELGELDQQISSAADAVKARFAK